MARKIWRKDVDPGKLYYSEEDDMYFITLGGGGLIWDDEIDFFIEEYGYTGKEVTISVGGIEDQ